MAAGDTFILKVNGRLFGQVTQTVLHFEEITPLAAGDAAFTLATQWVTDASGLYRACCSLDWTLDSVSCQKVKPLPALEVQVVIVNLPGTRVAGACPPQVAAVITKRTGLAGRANRGRVYMPAVPEADHQDGLLVTSLVSALASFGTRLNTDVVQAAGRWRNIIRSRRLNGAPRDTNLVLTAFTVRNVAHVQRRRTLGVGV